MKKVLVFGTFDGLHKGHINFFEQAKKHGDYLIVVIARDSTVVSLRGRPALNNEAKRLAKVKLIKVVDEVLLGNKGNPYKIVKDINPDVICLGYDQNHFTKDLPDKLKEMGLSTKVLKMKPYHPEKYHSSIINKINVGH